MAIRFQANPEEKARKREKLRKQKYGFHDFAKLDQLAYPGHVTAQFEHFETGGGTTRGIFLAYVLSAEGLRRRLIAVWGNHFAECCELCNGLAPQPEYDGLISAHARFILDQIHHGISPSFFEYAATLNENYA